MRIKSLEINKQSWMSEDDIITYTVKIEVYSHDLLRLIDALTDATKMKERYMDLETEASKRVAELEEEVRVLKIDLDQAKTTDFKKKS